MKKTFALLFLVIFSSMHAQQASGNLNLPSENILAQAGDFLAPGEQEPEEQGYVINFNDVSIIEFIRFISRISDKNFIFDEKELEFNVTIVSQEPTSVQNIMAALLQVLRINGLTLLEQGNSIIIHRNANIRRPARIITADGRTQQGEEEDIVTRVYRLRFADPERIAEVIRPVVSEVALIDVLVESRHVVVTDLGTNVDKITDLIQGLDRPNQALTIGQYVVQNSVLESLITLAERILRPIAGETPLFLVPQNTTSSIYVISTPYFVRRAMAVLETVDVPFGRTRILSFREIDSDEGEGEDVTGLGARRRLGREFGGFGDPGEQGIRSAEEGFGAGQTTGFEGSNFITEERPTAPGQGTQPGVDRFLPSQRGGLPFGLGQFDLAGEDLELPLGHIDATTFFVYKLEYRRGDQIVEALGNIAEGLAASGTVNFDLLSAISSAQWIPTSNSIVFAGTRAAIDRVRELMEDIDVPLRQVFIEMLILETSVDNSLQFGAEWGTLISEPEFGANSGFFSTGSALVQSLSGVTAGANVDPVGLASAAGLSLGVIGKNVTFGGMGFESLGVLIQALNTDSNTNIIMNPKIITEDNSPAEIFVGENTRFRTQSIASQASTNVITNFEYRDVGSRLRVLPIIGNNDVITLEIDQEITSDTGTAGEEQSQLALELGPVTQKTTTQTRVHIPNKYFLITSGMIREEKVNVRSEIPCLGGIPVLGTLFSKTTQTRNKRNLMIFIRPHILDTAEDVREITRQQQQLFRDKSRQGCEGFDHHSCLDFLKPDCGC